jgi:uncharacterized membrane protein
MTKDKPSKPAGLSKRSRSKSSHPKLSDERLEIMMGRLLQAGVLLASAVVLLGGALYVRQNSGHPTNYQIFSGEPSDLRHPFEMFRLVGQGNPAAIVQLGILLLIATPVARVLLAIIGFAIERDRLYVVVSVIVFSVLMFSIFH